MVLADRVLHARQGQRRLIDRPGPEGLAHKQARSDSRKRRHQNPLFLGRLLADAILWPRVDDEENLLMTFTGGKGELTPFHKELLERALDSKSGSSYSTPRLTALAAMRSTNQVKRFVGTTLGSIARTIKGAVVPAPTRLAPA